MAVSNPSEADVRHRCKEAATGTGQADEQIDQSNPVKETSHDR
jgi:hypothetical protein